MKKYTYGQFLSISIFRNWDDPLNRNNITLEYFDFISFQSYVCVFFLIID